MVNISCVTLEDDCLVIGYEECVVLDKYHISVCTCDPSYCNFEYELSSKDRETIKKWASEL